MKIAVSSRGQSLNDAFDPSFGRCAGFVIYDSTNQTSSFLDNSQQQNLPQGAGLQAAQMMSNAGIDVLITGQIGPNAMQALSRTRIQLFSGTADTVQDAIKLWQRNGLEPMSTTVGQIGAGQGLGGGGGLRGRGPAQGGRGMGGGARGRGLAQGGRRAGGGGQGRGPAQGGQGLGGGGKGKGPDKGGQGMGGGGEQPLS